MLILSFFNYLILEFKSSYHNEFKYFINIHRNIHGHAYLNTLQHILLNLKLAELIAQCMIISFY